MGLSRLCGALEKTDDVGLRLRDEPLVAFVFSKTFTICLYLHGNSHIFKPTAIQLSMTRVGKSDSACLFSQNRKCHIAMDSKTRLRLQAFFILVRKLSNAIGLLPEKMCDRI